MSACLTSSQLTAYLAEQLSTQDTEAVDAHLQTCESCRREMESQKAEEALFSDLVFAIQPGPGDDLSDVAEPTSDDGFNAALEREGYRIVEEIHRGGQGIVFKAIQIANGRIVAVKRLLSTEFSTPEQMHRFEREIEVIVRLNHRHIVTVFDSGVAHGCPYFAMELIEGHSLDRFVAETVNGDPQSRSPHQIREILELFRKIGAAVAYAHQMGVIHRDLKPSNIMVESSGDPRVLDFGLAKAAQEGPGRSLTLTGQFLGTLAYASPEQVQRDTEWVDVRSDVYSLGVILYELLTGQLPYQVDGGLSQTIRNIIERDPVPPRRLSQVLNADVETIVLKALQKDPNRRYASVGELVQDITFYLTDQPIAAKRDHTLYVIKKTLKRFRLFVATAAVLLVVITTALVASLFFWSQAIDQRNVAREASKQESIARDGAEFQSYVANIVAAKGAILSGDVAEAKRRLNNAPKSFRNWEWNYWNSRTDKSLRTLSVHTLYITDFQMMPDRKTVVSLAGDNTLKVWDVETSTVVQSVALAGPPQRCRVSGDGAWIAALVIGSSIHVFDARTRKETHTYRHPFEIQDLAFAFDEPAITFASKNMTTGQAEIHRWSFETNKTKLVSQQWDRIESLAMHPHRPLLAITGTETGILDLTTTEFQRFPQIPFSRALCFNDSGDQLAVALEDEAMIIDIDSGQVRSRMQGHERTIKALAFNTTGDCLATASYDRTIRIWDSGSGNLLSLLAGHDQAVTSVDFLNEERLLSGSNDANFKVWSPRPRSNPRRWLTHGSIVRDIKFHPRRPLLATAGDDGQVVIRNVETGEVWRVLRHEGPVFSICFSPSGSEIATAGDELDIRIWDLETGTAVTLPGHTDRVHSINFSMLGDRLVSGSRDRSVRIWDRESQKSIFVIDHAHDCVHAAVFDRAGDRIATRGHREVALWNVATLEKLQSFPQRMGSEDYSLVFHPNASVLAAGCSIEGFGRGYVNLLDGDSLQLTASLEQHNSPITSFDFNHDGTRAVSSSSDAIKVWNLERHAEVATLDGVDQGVYNVEYSEDGNLIAAGLYDGHVVVWDACTKQ